MTQKEKDPFDELSGCCWLILVIIALSIYYPYRWYQNSQHKEGILVYKCWLAREMRVSENDNDILYLDGEQFKPVKQIQHGKGNGPTVGETYYGETNGLEVVYQGYDGNLMSLYIWTESPSVNKIKLGMKLLGYKFYLPCKVSESADSW